MGEAEKATEKAAKGTGGRASAASGNAKRVAAGRKRERARGTAVRKNGAEQLRQAADKQVGKNSQKLADMLTEKALKGDLASAKVLVGLAERKRPQPEPVKRRRGPSVAERLAAEPQWEGPMEGDEEEGGTRE